MMFKRILSVVLSCLLITGMAVSVFASDSDSIKAAKDALVFSALSEESINEVTQNINLPMDFHNGTAIFWTSSNENIIAISGTTGVVKRPPYGEGYAYVLLTANLSYGSENAVKYFLARVPEEHSAYQGSAKMATACADFEEKFLSVQNPIDLRSNLIIPESSDPEVLITCLSDNTEALRNDGVITRSVTEDQMAEFVVTFTLGYEITRRSFPIVVKAIEQDDVLTDIESDLDWVLADLNEKHNISRLTEDMTLPAVGPKGTVLSYSSSNTDVLSSDGKVYRDDSDKTAVLTIIGTFNGETISKTLSVTIPGESGSGIGSQTGGLSGGGGGGGGLGGGNITMPDSGSASQSVVSGSVFTDLPKTHWSYDAVKYLYDRGVVGGMGDGSFAPDALVTREQMVKMIVDAMPNITADFYDVPFNDTPQSAWFSKYVATAYRYNLVRGISDTEFGVGNQISRQDLSVMIDNALTFMGKTPSVRDESSSFADMEIVSGYAKDAVTKLKSYGMVTGRGDNQFFPKDALTRAEAAMIIYRMLTF